MLIKYCKKISTVHKNNVFQESLDFLHQVKYSVTHNGVKVAIWRSEEPTNLNSWAVLLTSKQYKIPKYYSKVQSTRN